MFYPLRYSVAGEYNITATSSATSSSNSSNSFEVVEAHGTIVVDFPDKIMQNTLYRINIRVKDQFGEEWFDPLKW